MKRNPTFRLAALGLWAVLSVGPVWPQEPRPIPEPGSAEARAEEIKELQRQYEEKWNSPYPDMTGLTYWDRPMTSPVNPPRLEELLPPQAPTPEKNNTPKKPPKRNPVWRFFAWLGGA